MLYARPSCRTMKLYFIIRENRILYDVCMCTSLSMQYLKCDMIYDIYKYICDIRIIWIILSGLTYVIGVSPCIVFEVHIYKMNSIIN